MVLYLKRISCASRIAIGSPFYSAERRISPITWARQSSRRECKRRTRRGSVLMLVLAFSLREMIRERPGFLAQDLSPTFARLISVISGEVFSFYRFEAAKETKFP